eukprot:COSAG06_NODE_4939_length_3846_cov_1.922338_1_plen_196_part_10
MIERLKAETLIYQAWLRSAIIMSVTRHNDIMFWCVRIGCERGRAAVRRWLYCCSPNGGRCRGYVLSHRPLVSLRFNQYRATIFLQFPPIQISCVNELILAHRRSAGWRWSSLNNTASIKLALSVAGCVSADTILLMLNGQPLDEEPREITPRNGESLKLNRVRFWCVSGKAQADSLGHTQHGSETQQLRGWFERTR